MLCSLALAGVAEARLPQLVTTTGKHLGGNWTRLLGQAKVPLVSGKVQLVFTGCPHRPDLAACVLTRHPRRIYLRRSLRQRRTIFFHELGHVFDLKRLNRAERRSFKAGLGLEGGWYTGASPPAELFADGYSLCARHRSITGRPPPTAYGYSPAPQQHAAVCRLIRRAADSHGAKPQAPKRPPAVVEPPPPPPAPCGGLKRLLGGC